MEDEQITKGLECLFVANQDPSRALSHFVPALLLCDKDSPELECNLVLSRLDTSSVHDVDTLPVLSLAEQCVIVALKRTIDKVPSENVTFDALYEEYSTGFPASAKVEDAMVLARKFNRIILRAAVDNLSKNGILNITSSDSSQTMDTRQAIHFKMPLCLLPKVIPDCPVSLCKLAEEVR